MGLFGNLFKRSSDEDLSAAYENERQRWIKGGFNGGTGEKSAKMIKLDKKMNKRAAKKHKNNPSRNPRWTDANRWDKD